MTAGRPAWLSCRMRESYAANGNPETAFEVSDCTANATLPHVSAEINRDLWTEVPAPARARPGGLSNNTPPKIAAVRLTYLPTISDASPCCCPSRFVYFALNESLRCLVLSVTRRFANSGVVPRRWYLPCSTQPVRLFANPPHVD